MCSIRRLLIFFAAFVFLSEANVYAQDQDKELSKQYMDLAMIMMTETRAIDDAREQMVAAANYDTTNLKANLEAGRAHLSTIGKEHAVKYFLRVYRQNPNYLYDLEYWIGMSYQYGMEFDKAIDFYSRYKRKISGDNASASRSTVGVKETDRRLYECTNGKEFMSQPQKFSVVNLGREINSEFEDYAPVLNEDETEIVFTTRRRDGNLNENVWDDNKPYEDMFFSTKVGDKWSRAKNMGKVVNTPFNDSNLALSADGKTLFLYEDVNGGDIFVSNRNADGSWSTPKPLPGLVNSKYVETSVSITKDGKTIYFASDRPGGKGGKDIYTASLGSSGDWVSIKNLGDTINTEFEEDSPFIDYDNKTLFFSSTGMKGMGGFDIFKSILSNNKWSTPENLGYPINTPDDDIYYVSTGNGERGYYSSVRDDGMGYSDIYLVTVPQDPIVETKKELIPTTYIVRVMNELGSPVEAKIKLEGATDNRMVSATSGGTGVYNYSITSSQTKNYRLSVEKDGYIFENITVPIPGASEIGSEVIKTITLRKLVVGTRSVLRNIYFDFDKATFLEESYNELNKLEAMMRQNSALRVEISGHTDSWGPDAYNVKLSQRRADAVKNFLTSKGIDARRVTSKGFGDTRPLVSNDDEVDGRAINRRVEFKVTGN
ncbi:MAG: OmpA family protein [Flammeovirgaceae bacterium]|nr:OmpA family protein [Flammeovirgaceae bacterium]